MDTGGARGYNLCAPIVYCGGYGLSEPVDISVRVPNDIQQQLIKEHEAELKDED